MQTVKMMLLLIPVLFFGVSLRPSMPPAETLWMSLPDAEGKMKSEKRPILIDLYTDWCGWCKVMDKKTYSNSKVSQYLAKKFYAVKVNAESKEAFEWNGKKYTFNSRYKTNDFAIYLTQGQLSYPTTVILPSDGSQPQAIPGFMEPRDFELVLRYFGDGHFGKTSFDSYKRSFTPTW